MDKKKDRQIVSFIFGLIIILLSLFVLGNFYGLVALICGLVIFPPIVNFIRDKFNFQIKKYMKVLIAIIGFILVFTAIVSKSNERISGNINEKIIPLSHSPCDFLPDYDIIPTEFKIIKPELKNNTCKQSIYETLGTQAIIELSLFKDLSESRIEFNRVIQDEKASRGYTEISGPNNCFSIEKSNPLHSFIYVHCRWGNMIYKETIVDIGTFQKKLFLDQIPKNIKSKVEKSS